MKTKNNIIKVLCMLLIMTITSVSTVCADDVDNEYGNEQEIEADVLEAVNNLSDFPAINSRRYVVYDRISKRVLYGKNENVKGAMASTTKIMTCLVTLENADINQVVTISSKAAGTGGSRLGLKKNDEITVECLLYGLMLRSGNDAAVALAETVGGSVEGFAELMNDKAKVLGLNSTHFVTPHGLDDPEHYTTAAELAKIADYAMENEKFAEIVGTKSITISINGYSKQIFNTNELLGVLNGVIGIKTGFTNNAGRCLVTETKRGNMDIIVVTLGADTKKYRTQDNTKLIEYTYSNYDIINVREKIQDEFETWKNINQKRIEIVKGSKNYVDIKLGEISILNMAVKQSEVDNIKFDINCMTILEAPIKSNIKVGTLTVTLNGKIIDIIDILTSEEIEKKDWKEYYIELIEKFREQLEYYVKYGKILPNTLTLSQMSDKI